MKTKRMITIAVVAVVAFQLDALGLVMRFGWSLVENRWRCARSYECPDFDVFAFF